jgi:hypothetical protein
LNPGQARRVDRGPERVSLGDSDCCMTKQGQEIDRNIYGQFAERLGRGFYEGI